MYFPAEGRCPPVIQFSTVFSIVHPRRMGAGHVISFVCWVDSTGCWVKDGFENGQERGKRIAEESLATLQNKSLEPSKRWGVGDYLVSGWKSAPRVWLLSLQGHGGTSR